MNPNRTLLARLARSSTLALACTLLAGAAWAQKHSHGAHVHGLVKADVAVEGNKLSLQFEMPLDSLLAFEHRPRTDAQRAAAQAMVQVLQQPANWLRPDAAALCTLGKTEVDSQAVEPTRPGEKDRGHADIEARYEYTCAAADKLTGVDLLLMNSFKRIEQVQLQVAGAKGQSKQTLRRPATRVVLKK